MTSIWGERRVPNGTRSRFKLGPLWLEIANVGLEWHVAARSGAQGEDHGLSVEEPAGDEPAPEGMLTTRYGVGDTGDSLRLTPQLADKPIVARPEAPYVVAAGGKVEVHVSHPLWVRVEVGRARVKLCELPAREPRQTWFGSPTDGHLCYALHTSLRQRIEELEQVPYRGATTVTVHNEAQTPLSIDRLRIPVTALALYHVEGRLVTSSMTLHRTSGDEAAVMRIVDKPPSGAELLTAARSPQTDGPVERVFNAFFG